MSERARGGTFRAALRHRDYRLLLAGLAVSESGNWLYGAASIVYILEATGSAAWVAVAGVVRLLPFVLFEPLGGAIADRYDRRRVMIASDLARFALMLVLTVVATSTSTTAVIVAIVIAFVNNTCSTPYFPAVTAITPSIVGEEDLAAANALSGTIDNFAIAFGPALSVVFLLLGPPPVAFGVNALTFLFSAYMVWKIGIHGKVGEVEVEPTLRSRVVAGARAIRGSREAMLLVGLTMAFGFTFGQEVVLFGPITEDFLGLGLDATGLLFAAPGVGGILATAAAARLASRSHTAAILTIATLVSAIPIMSLSVLHNPAAAYLLMTVEGAAIIIADVVSTTTLQRVVPRDRIGSVFGIVGSLTVAAIAFGSIVAPFTIGLLGLGGAAAAAGAMLLVVTLASLPGARALDKLAAARLAELAPAVALLERLGLFETAPPAQIEALAAVATREVLPSGTVAIREGDEPDNLFAIESGVVEVTAERADGPLARLGAGDYVGEIGLLEKRPRTATVTAVSEVVLYRIPGEEFLRIANEGPRISTTLLAVMANRLATSSGVDELGHA
ncbi:MAG: MFS transporter [Actinomycetota bacterium]|nr:MFS transporter [Actinomycetota bacterium]